MVNFDLPQCPEDYIHRIGRTGRAGNEGTAINLVTNQDGMKWRNICRLINPNDKSQGGGGSGGPKRSAGYSKKPRDYYGAPRRSFDDKKSGYQGQGRKRRDYAQGDK